MLSETAADGGDWLRCQGAVVAFCGFGGLSLLAVGPGGHERRRVLPSLAV